MSGAAPLKIKSVIGFNGKVARSLHYTPCGKYIVYPLGSFIVIKNVLNEKEAFIDGHTNLVSAVTVSHDGTKLATGQINITGVKADIIVWDLEEAKRLLDDGEVMIGERIFIHRLKQHLSRVQDLSFSCEDTYLASMGGQDDNCVCIWNMETGYAVCGAPAGSDSGLAIKWLNNRNDRFVTSGNFHLRVWQIDFQLPKLHCIDAKLGMDTALLLLLLMILSYYSL
jgi:cilia- and flagella-associated protein 52